MGGLIHRSIFLAWVVVCSEGGVLVDGAGPGTSVHIGKGYGGGDSNGF